MAMAYWRGSSTPLKKEESWTSMVGLRDRHERVEGTVFSDKAGKLFIEQSVDGQNWDVIETYEIKASEGKGFTEPLITAYWRIKFTNTSATESQTKFRISAFTAGWEST